MVFVFECQRAVGTDTIREVWVAARNEDQVTLEAAFLVEFAGAKDFRVKSVIGAEFCEQGAFGKKLCCGSRDEEFVRVM